MSLFLFSKRGGSGCLGTTASGHVQLAPGARAPCHDQRQGDS
jgi:hypothetical protein